MLASHLPLTIRGTIHFLKAILDKRKSMSTTIPTLMDATAALGNSGPRDHLQVTSSQQRDTNVHEMKVSKIRDLSPTVKKVVLHTDIRPVPFSFKAGQWVDVFIPGVEKVGGFSMTSSPTQLQNTGNLDLAVKYSEHSPAKWVHKECKEGSSLSIRVGGDFLLDYQMLTKDDSKGKVLLFIAGGVGINPISSMISEMRDFNRSSPDIPQHKSVLLFSAKTPEELLFREEFNRIAENYCFTPFYFLTGNQGAEPQHKYPHNLKRERITHETLYKIITDLLLLKPNSEEISKNLQVYICGPPDFITFVNASALDMGVKKIFFENWWQ